MGGTLGDELFNDMRGLFHDFDVLDPVILFCKRAPMTKRPINVLFLCTGNSARSILAEAILSNLGREHGFLAWSAGSKPSGQPHPNALAELERRGHRSEFYRSKSWDEFADADGPIMDIVVTVCGSAANEVCPVWPKRDDQEPIKVHWPAEDPAYIEDDAERERAFAQVYDLMRRRVEGLVALDRTDLRDESVVQALS